MRALCWFSCGATSAVAAKCVVEKYGGEATIAYCDTMASEHPDNQRFFDDVQSWIGVNIVRLPSEKYASVEDVFEKRRYMSGIAGAICTVEMKKVPRFAFQRADDVHIFGFAVDELKRIALLESNNHELDFDWVLRDRILTKARCQSIIVEAGIALPAMYGLGYEHNNCVGCVKATSPGYWNKIRRDFPIKFTERAVLSRELGARLVRFNGERIFLDELPKQAHDMFDEDLSCGPDCRSTLQAALADNLRFEEARRDGV